MTLTYRNVFQADEIVKGVASYHLDLIFSQIQIYKLVQFLEIFLEYPLNRSVENKIKF